MLNLDEEKALFQSLLSEAARTGAQIGPLIHAQKARLRAYRRRASAMGTSMT